MSLFLRFEDSLRGLLGEWIRDGRLPEGLSLAAVSVEPPREAAHGDLATNAAMVLAKPAGRNPRELAQQLAEAIKEWPDVREVSIAGPGFLNLKLDDRVYEDVLRSLLADPVGFGRGAKKPGRVNIEYVSANPTGPMHVGHGRGAVFGDALANLLVFAGHDVVREYYINDAGAQVDVLARSAFLRYSEALGEEISIPEGLYPGAYLKPVGEALAREHGETLKVLSEPHWLPVVREAAIKAMMAMIREDLAAMDIRHDVFFSEASLSQPQNYSQKNVIAVTLERLREQGFVGEGRLEPPKGQPVEDWEDRQQTLFFATRFGDDVDRPLIKSDGSYTYFASDIAYHASKFSRGFDTLIDVWGADHGGYVKRMQAAVQAVTDGKASLEVRLCQLVRLMRAGEPVKMSKRAGDFITLREVVEEVGKDPVRFMMLMRKNDAPLDFDLAAVREQSKDNPVFYVQYAHARCASVFRQAQEAGFSSNVQTDLALLVDEAEKVLLRRIAQYPRVIEQAASAREPHRIAFFLQDFAALFHGLWNKGKEAPQLRFVNPTDPHSTIARLALVEGVKAILASGLGILGVSAPEEMR
jgi:arginyl-tRNA synthetase